MRTSLAPLLAAAMAMGVAAAPAEATHSRGKCKASGRTVVKNDSGRLFERTNTGGGLTLFGCLWSANRTVTLETAFSDPTVDHTYGQERLAGRYAAWTTSTEDVSCKAQCPPGYEPLTFRVNLMNLRTRDERSIEGLPTRNAFRLNENGAVAWLASLGNGQRELHLWTARRHDVLDTGPIASGSVRLDSEALSWVNGDVQHTVPVR